jgi:septum formation topological specificity factor MinE
MKRFVNSKTALAAECQTTRQTIYALLRMSGCPKPRADGRYCVAEFTRFLNRIKHDKKNSEKDQLQLSLMTLKVKRAERELADFEENLRKEILDVVLERFIRALAIHRRELDQMLLECSPRSEGLGVTAIYKLWKARLNKAFENIQREIKEGTGATIPDIPAERNVIPFRQKKVATA